MWLCFWYSLKFWKVRFIFLSLLIRDYSITPHTLYLLGLNYLQKKILWWYSWDKGTLTVFDSTSSRALLFILYPSKYCCVLTHPVKHSITTIKWPHTNRSAFCSSKCFKTMQIAVFLPGKYARKYFFSQILFRRMDWQRLAISMLTLFLPLEGDNFLSLSTILHQNKSVFCLSIFVQALLCISQM